MYNIIRTLFGKYLKNAENRRNRAFIEKGGFAVKVRSSVSLFARNAKSSREKEASELSVRIRSTNRDRVNYFLTEEPVICALWSVYNRLAKAASHLR